MFKGIIQTSGRIDLHKSLHTKPNKSSEVFVSGMQSIMYVRPYLYPNPITQGCYVVGMNPKILTYNIQQMETNNISFIVVDDIELRKYYDDGNIKIIEYV